ncbi:hypothetical protein GMORB2_1905 [Geosmithia morbida]|uniref:Uncharacterized protein n=1 Tax=Geosmithia morbida TaxID=1094350 RepID=A0A9P4YTN1_9HYPO|nr:uncharacterized protein GMORB2_1905 [Geosmithia morbida]KAF4121498.1 hypothetical protein GMORB2_1905 [Geosmithia morbida]
MDVRTLDVPHPTRKSHRQQSGNSIPGVTTLDAPIGQRFPARNAILSPPPFCLGVWVVLYPGCFVTLSKEELEPTVVKFQPDILCCASMWTVEESTQMREKAKSLVPGIKTHAIPHGLQVKDGPDAIVEHLKVQLPALLE